MRYALVKDGEIVEFRNYAPNVDQDELAPGKPRMLPVETLIAEFDPVAEVQQGPAYEVEAARVVERYTSRPKNPDEIAAMIAAKDAEIETEFARLCSEPIAYSVGGVEYQFHADAEARENIQGVLNMYNEGDRMGEPLPDPRMWKPKDGTPVAITRDELAGLGIAIGQRKDELFVVKVTKQATLAALADPVDIDAFDPLSGWAV